MKNKFTNSIISSIVVTTCMMIIQPADAATFAQVKATWTGDGEEPGIKEFANIACVDKGFTSAVKFDPNPSSGAYEEDGKIVSYMEFASIDCK